MGIPLASDPTCEGTVEVFYMIKKNNSNINLMLQLLVFLMNRSPSVENGCSNGIHCRWWAPIIYD